MSSGTQMLIALFIGIVLLILLILKTKVHAFLGLIIAAVVIGGTSFAGGEGGIIQSFIGLMAVQMLTTCMAALSVDGFWQKLIEGLMIVAIIAADCYSRKRKRENV